MTPSVNWWIACLKSALSSRLYSSVLHFIYQLTVYIRPKLNWHDFTSFSTDWAISDKDARQDHWLKRWSIALRGYWTRDLYTRDTELTETGRPTMHIQSARSCVFVSCFQWRQSRLTHGWRWWDCWTWWREESDTLQRSIGKRAVHLLATS